MKRSPLVSVIIPMYNVARYISETIQSVINQTYTNWEVIIIDDGSKDNSAAVVKGFLHDTRVRYYYQDNAGVSVARNLGLSIAKGEYLTFLDADDMFMPEFINSKLSYLEEHQELHFVYSDLNLIDENSQDLALEIKSDDKDLLDNLLLWERNMISAPASNLFIRRICYDEGLMFDPNLSNAADRDFCIHLVLKYQGKYLREELTNYRMLSTSMSRNLKLQEDDSLRMHFKLVKEKVYPSFWFERRVLSNILLMISGSCWVQGKNKSRGLLFLARAMYYYPPNIRKILIKFL